MQKRILLCLIAAMIIMIPVTLWCASFNCAKASSRSEKMICSNEEISKADESLARVYKLALASTQDKAALKQQQKDWLKDVRNKCQDSACLKRIYNDRLIALNSVTASSATTIGDITGTYQYAEKGFSGTMKVSEISECKLAPNKLGCLSSMVLVAKIDTMHKASANDCDIDVVENKSARITSVSKTEVTFVAKDKSDGDTGLEVIFSTKGADIKSSNGGCGMQGSVLGHWKRSNR